MSQNVKPPATRRIVTRELPVELTERELYSWGGFIAAKLQERDRIASEAKLKAAEYKGQIKAVDAEVAKLADERATGKAVRPVQCEERWHAGTIQVVRSDTGEVIDSRAATLQDAQEDLPITGRMAAPDEPRDELGHPTRWEAAEVDAGEVVGLGDFVPAPSSPGGYVESATGGEVYVTPDDPEPDFVTDHEPAPDLEVADVPLDMPVEVEIDQAEMDSAFDGRAEMAAEAAEHEAGEVAPKTKAKKSGSKKAKAKR